MMMVSWSAMILGLLIWAKVKSINMVSHLSTNARGRRYIYEAKPNYQCINDTHAYKCREPL
jgi:hypothetical protein